MIRIFMAVLLHFGQLFKNFTNNADAKRESCTHTLTRESEYEKAAQQVE